jgi:hypothetical protein
LGGIAESMTGDYRLKTLGYLKTALISIDLLFAGYSIFVTIAC